VVSFDFTIAIVPGWHSTFFPPYFVAGAIYSGFGDGVGAGHSAARRLRLAGTDHAISTWTIAAKVMLATGLIVAYAYILRNLHRLVQRQRLRAGGFLASHDRPLCFFVLGYWSVAT